MNENHKEMAPEGTGALWIPTRTARTQAQGGIHSGGGMLLAILAVLLSTGAHAWGQACVQWVQRTDVGTPGKRVSPGLAYDSDRGVTVFFGGEYSDAGSSTINYYNDTWEYDGERWRQIIVNGPKPDIRSGHAMVYDAARKKVVLFGGVNDSGYFGDTWVYTGDGTNGYWTRLYYATGPRPRAAHSMIYDTRRNVTFLVGGSYEDVNHAEPAADAWTWDGNNWIQVGGFLGEPSDNYPTEITRGALAYDPIRGVTVQFGGVFYNNTLNNTYTVLASGTREYDGTHWHDVRGGTPSLRQQHATAFDSSRGSVVMFGGVNDAASGGSDAPIGADTDEYIGGAGWISLFRGGPPPPRARHAMVFDSKRGRIVMFGGASGDARYDDTWELVNLGPTFTAQPQNKTLPACSQAVFTVAVSGDPPQTFQWYHGTTPLAESLKYVGVTSHTLEVNEIEFADQGSYYAQVKSPCGTNDSEAGILTVSNSWTFVSANGPSPRSQFGLAYDSRRGVTVLFGGASQNSLNSETWEWNGNTWSLRATNGPSPRYGVLMAYDTDRGRTLCFGGNTNSASYNYNYPQELWEWDGLTWTLRTTGGPPGRIAGGCAYDSATQRFVIFGGFGVASTSLAWLFDTWEFDGVSGIWTKVADGPTAPFGGAVMAFDTARNKRVLVSSPPSVYDHDLRVYEWAAPNWVEQTVLPDSNAGKPNRALVGEAIAYHAGRGMVVINNGTTGGNFYSRSTWGYDGTSWQLLSQNDGPPANDSAGMVYDSARTALVEFGGAHSDSSTGTSLLGQTWDLADADHLEIVHQPASLLLVSNQVVRFTLTVRGVLPMMFQWRKNQTNLVDGGKISGSTTGTLTISNADRNIDVGLYDVLVQNACGSLFSSPAALVFTNAPHVDSISGGGTNSVCGAATLHASVSGTAPYTFQWRRNGTPLVADPFTSGVTTDTLTLNSLRLADTGNYDVLVTDANAPAVNTGLAVIQVLPKPWTLVGTNGPSPRDQFGLAYDSRRGVTVLFGGASQNSLSRETWEWNGNTWSLRATNGPSPRYGVLMAYDTDRGRTLCFGGNIASASYNYNYPQELWEWDGLTWTLRTTGGAPGRIAGGCAYDSATHKFVVFGGFGVAGASPGKLFDTWECDAAAGAWTKVADGPTAPFGGAIMAFDSARNKRVLISSGPTIYDKDLRVFEWAVTKWVEQSVLPDPLAGKPNRALVGEAIAYHPARGMVVINNGKTDSTVYSRSTWGYDGTSWRLLTQNDGPPANESAGMAYDSGRSALVEFGGATGLTLLGQTWELPNSDRIQILQQPFSTAVAANQLTRFVVMAGGAPPLRFQWRKDGGGLADGPGISGATTGTLTITNANPLTDAGSYDVLVSNDCGSVPSATAILAFIAPSLRLGLTPSPGAIVLTWSAPNMVLQSAPAPAGPWQTVLGATSPYPVVLSEGQLFFRLVSQ